MYASTTRPVRLVTRLQQTRFTSQSKKNRIEIQLLKTFPGVGVAGQILKVKPSAMINKFHPNGGAAYLNYKGAEPRIPVVTKAPSKVVDVDAEMLAKQAAKALRKQQRQQAAEKSIQKDLKTLSLDDILNIDFNVLTAAQLTTIFNNMPKNFVFVKSAEDKVLAAPITVATLKAHIQAVLSKSVRQSDIILKFVNGKSTSVLFTSEDGTPLEDNTVTSVGNYFVTVANGDQSANIQLTVNAAK